MTGFRKGNILSLKWDQVDFARSEIRLERTKSGHPEVHRVNRDVVVLLEGLKARGNGSDYVFPDPRTRRPYGEIRKAFKAACRRAGIRNLRFHDLRHVFATDLVRNGVELPVVQKALGHSDVRTTQRYVNLDLDDEGSAVETLCKRQTAVGRGGEYVNICERGAAWALQISLFSRN